ncbi:membrane protein [Streptomyces paromomycinus]|uniref:Membrane protein n=1 Tax=Streptomyces paromomycinus TaxID=92743 RepID=A0A401WAV7_STREY|nr:membrane protein [Streptomyces paromomycinus]
MTEYGYSNLSTGAQRLVTISCVSVLPLVFTSGWASGINAYAVVLLLGVLGATGAADEVPAALQRTDVLIVAGVLFLIEAVADKIPYVDSVWDAVHTVVRPVSGGVVAALLAGHDGSLPELAAGAVGGTSALVSHLVKAGTRMAVNTSPEPASNFVLSTLEDLGVAGIVVFAVFHPVAAAIVAGVLLVGGIVLVAFLWSRVRRFLRRRRQRREERHLAAAREGSAPVG